MPESSGPPGHRLPDYPYLSRCAVAKLSADAKLQSLIDLVVFPLLRVDMRAWQITLHNYAFESWYGAALTLPMPYEALFAPPLNRDLCRRRPAPNWSGDWWGRLTIRLPAGARHGAQERLAALDARPLNADAGKDAVFLVMRPAEKWLLHLPHLSYLETVLQNFPAFVGFRDAEGKLMVASGNVEEVFQGRADELQGKNIADILPAPVLRTVKRLDAQAVAGRRRVVADIHWLENALGSDDEDRAVWLHTVRDPLFDRAGNYIAMMTTATDVSDRYRIETQLNRRDVLLRATARAAGLLLPAMEDFDGAINEALGLLGAAAQADRVYVWRFSQRGGARAKYYATQVYEWVNAGIEPWQEPEKTQDAVITGRAELWLEMFRKGECINTLVDALPDAERAVMREQGIQSILLAPVICRGKLWGFIGFDDCSRRRVWTRPEENILRTAGALIGSVLDNHQMKQALLESNQRLARSVKAAGKLAGEATRASRSKSDFLANVSHEIRTPMNAIVGLTYLALQREIGPDVRDFLEKIQDAARSLLGLIDDILDFSKIEAGTLELENVRFSLRETLMAVHDELKSRALEKRLRVHLHIDENVPDLLEGDPLRLRQVLGKLIANAVKFTERGSVETSVSVDRLDGSRVRLRFAVRDTGIGISPEARRHIFAAFDQADSSTTRKYGGTGLGLAICMRLAALMRGSIGCNSEPGKGSTFFFTAEFTLPEPAAGSRDSAATDGSGRFVGKRVLLVEDNAINQLIATELLEQAGFTVHVAGTGYEALDALEAEAFDIVLMDIQMPQMDGYTATRKIREDPRFARLPILAMTANAMPRDRERSLAAGMNSHIAKPIQPEELLAELGRWLPN